MSVVNRLSRWFRLAGLSVLEPIIRLLACDQPRVQIGILLQTIVAPIIAFIMFLFLWHGVAVNIRTNYGTLPTPVQVFGQAKVLWAEHRQSRATVKKFSSDNQKRAEAFFSRANNFDELVKTTNDPLEREKFRRNSEILRQRAISTASEKLAAPPTFIDQIFTSLKTVFAGFLLASVIAIPLGILCGLNRVFLAAVNPLVQIFKPVSPLAWLPIVMIIVGALYTTDPSVAWFSKSFVSSAITVALCSLWPTLVNTALAVSTIDQDYINVARMLRLNWFSRLTKIVIPASLPLMFAGLRISLGVGWMVLIAAEMLAQNPGLGKFVWDMFQNGSSQTLAKIMVAVFTIGIIGFLLDRLMIILHGLVSFEYHNTSRM